MADSLNEAQQFQQIDDEISLIDLFAVLLHYKKMIFLIVGIAIFFALTISIISLKLPPEKSFLPNQYTSKANMLINNNSSSKSSISSILSNATGGRSNLIGISASSGNTNSSLAIYLVSANNFVDKVVDKFNLIERYKIEDFKKSNSREIVKKKLKAEYDEKDGIFSVSFTDIDPKFTKQVVDYAVEYLEQCFLELGIDKNKIEKENLEKNINSTYKQIINLQEQIHSIENSVSYGTTVNIPSITLQLKTIELELDAQQEVYKQLRSQYEILKISMQSETPLFQILDKAEVPDIKSGPSRGKLCIVIVFAAGFMSVFMAFLLNAITSIKNDPEAIKKLKGEYIGENKNEN